MKMPLTPDSITNEEIIQTFQEAVNDIAVMISKLEDHIGHFEAIEEITQDNCDPSYEGHLAAEALGKVLATCVIYAKDYKDEPFINKNLKDK